ncbi:vitamin H transporter, putative [Talaromyces stipitatus ATCC 10500]|uniref:Vitamin H transporter, putative n=1 Tax=Talaromyces stipitatus (strain ATCC 10500 / CBS 375.48 / QM 6759 / NRRL 1006) TaxID=441959 RepID=B8LXR0_TALSN|nr:vitamin H transporter, putative [Talaromyces stipitatus ATCC 10500]EED24561.1 vitamin H transporter, putative [Talaromyces stipitatus ATCC 10500]
MTEIKVDNTPSVLSIPSDPEKDVAPAGNGEITGNEYVDPKIERSLVRKFDLMILPMCALVYYTHTLDRANLGNAKTMGLEKDLSLVNNEYSLVLILFYIPYGLCNIPAALLAKRFNPARVIPIMMGTWGSLSMITASTKNFGGLLTVRILIGVVEASFMPCVYLYYSLFYTRKELALRTAAWGFTGFIAGATSGLISWDVSRWHRSLTGWQYLFLIEGGMTVGLAVIVFLVLPRDTNTRWFTDAERRVAQIRLRRESNLESAGQISWNVAFQVFRTWQVWAFAAMAFLCGVGVASASNFLPTMVKRIAQSTPQGNLYTVGPNLVAAFVQIVSSWLSDRYQQRALVSFCTLLVSMIGFILLATLDLVNHVHVGYFLTYMITFGTYMPEVLMPLWLSSNLTNASSRAVALGLFIGGLNIGGILSSAVFRNQYAPVYAPALITVATCQGLLLVALIVMRQYYVLQNKKLARGEIERPKELENNHDFRYAI